MEADPVTSVAQRRIPRRKFIIKSFAAMVGVGTAGLGYTLFEAGWLRTREVSIKVPRLPKSFEGTKIAFLSDIHHGSFTGVRFIDHAVALSNAWNPDLVLLGGDYTHRTNKYAEPCMRALGKLKARLGIYGVLGNHDHWYGADITRRWMKMNNIREVTNDGVWIEQQGTRLRIGGVGDLWEDVQDLDAALDDTQVDETAIVMSHNPDFVEGVTDKRVGLVLSGHTHGGQVVLPGYGAPRVPSSFGQKYLYGLVKTPATQVYVTCGIGTVTPPMRFYCRPEVALITIM
jgi:predicted MPP superfamily phosphohydrolase